MFADTVLLLDRALGESGDDGMGQHGLGADIAEAAVVKNRCDATGRFQLAFAAECLSFMDYVEYDEL